MADGLPISGVKKYTCDNIKYLQKQDMLDVGAVLMRGGAKDVIKENADGCRVNLDNVPEPLIIQIYSLVKRRVDKNRM